MAKIEFPKWIYPDAPETTRGKIVHTDAEEAAYLAECGAAPVISDDAVPSSDVPEDSGGSEIQPEETVESLRAQLDALGITYHHMAGVKKLKEMLAKAQ